MCRGEYKCLHTLSPNLCYVNIMMWVQSADTRLIIIQTPNKQTQPIYVQYITHSWHPIPPADELYKLHTHSMLIGHSVKALAYLTRNPTLQDIHTNLSQNTTHLPQNTDSIPGKIGRGTGR